MPLEQIQIALGKFVGHLLAVIALVATIASFASLGLVLWLLRGP